MPEWAPKLSGVQVLVVDDQPDVCNLLTTILCLKDAKVQTANGMAEALAILPAWEPDIIISDIAMPGGDGYELISRVRNAGYHIPAIALTAHASAEDRIRALAAGFQMHLPKPVEPHELVVSIASLTGRFVRSIDGKQMPDESRAVRINHGLSLMKTTPE